MDGALCFGVLQAVWNSGPFVTELARVVKPGGEIWIDALNASGLRAAWDLTERRLRGRPMHLRYESPRLLMTALRRAGFSNLSRHWLIIVPSRFQQLQNMCESKLVQSGLRVVPFVGAAISHSFVIRGVRE